MTRELEEYLASGIIEMYCLDMATPEEAKELERLCAQYPAVRKELEEAQSALVSFSKIYERKPPGHMGGRILNSVEELKLNGATLSPQTGMLSEFIGISEYSDIGKWQKLTGAISPPTTTFDENGNPIYELYNGGNKMLAIMWVNKEVAEEIHDDLTESFLILEGRCTCIIGNEAVDMGPGSFRNIPLYTNHNLKVTSKGPVKLIFTREILRKAA